MREGSDRERSADPHPSGGGQGPRHGHGHGHGQGDGPGRGRVWPLVVIGVVLAWLLLSGGSVPGLSILWGMMPGTGGLLTIGHVVMLAFILVIANFVLRMPREGGPLVLDEAEDAPRPLIEAESRDDAEGAIGEEIEARGEFPETGPGRHWVRPDDRPVEDPRQDRGPSADG